MWQEKTGTSGTNSGGDEVLKFFNISLSIRGFRKLKPRMHTSSNGDRSVFFSVKENSEMAQEQEHRFRGSISLTTNDCIHGIVSAYPLVLVILMLKLWWHDTWFLMLKIVDGWMHIFRGSITLAEYNELLALWWFWNMISLLRSFWYWSWKVIFVTWWKVIFVTWDPWCKFVIFSHVRTWNV